MPTLTAGPPRHARPPRRRRRWGRVLLAVVLVLALGCAAVVIDALSRPGPDSPAAKLAEWGRDHSLGGLVTWLEQLDYEASPPPVGGEPAGGIPSAAGAIAQAATTAPMAPLAGGPALPGEGQWQTVAQVHGRPAVQVTTLRPDDTHTSLLVGVMRLDPQLVRGQLHPGSLDPGGSWQASTSVSPGTADLAAAFNGGFRLNDPSHPGYYSEGRTVAPLVPGAASLVLKTDGTADVGSWGQEVRMGPDVASVRQNLVMLVDGGQVNPTCATGGEKEWGNTIGQAAYVVRSGFGITASGAEVYVGGPALSVCSLGKVLQDAGVVRGMELDINPDWVSGTYYLHPGGGPASGNPLFPGEKVPPQHYFAPSSRDWFAWYLRP
jgi:hypothetical protein